MTVYFLCTELQYFRNMNLPKTFYLVNARLLSPMVTEITVVRDNEGYYFTKDRPYSKDDICLHAVALNARAMAYSQIKDRFERTEASYKSQQTAYEEADKGYQECLDNLTKELPKW